MKARSDELVLSASLKVEAFDAACFHAQQAVEKYLKAALTHAGAEFPYTHNLGKLLQICLTFDPSFSSLAPIVEPLTPYAVEMRYDADFWPSEETAEEAQAAVLKVKDCVLKFLPKRSGS